MKRTREKAPFNSGELSHRNFKVINDNHELVDHKRNTIELVDFFSKNMQGDADHNRRSNNNISCHDKTSVDIGLHLCLMGNSEGGQIHKERPDCKLIAVKSELERLRNENQMLRRLMDQTTRNYSLLYTQILQLMQQQALHKIQEQDDCTLMFSPMRNITNPCPSSTQLVTAPDPTKLESNEAPNLMDEDEESPSSSLRTNTLNYLSIKEGKPHATLGEPSSALINNFASWRSNNNRKMDQERNNGNIVEQVSADIPCRKARVSVQARSDAPMISDGCRWKKYGQKFAKGNPCPRAYYRCTMAVECSVQKQVQRCSEDKSILVTTYEGNHNHPLPPAAAAMAATTSSAAAMLLSGPTTGTDNSSFSSFPSLYPNNYANYSMLMPTLSASAPFPTITLDLTRMPTGPIQQNSHSQVI